MNIFSSIEQALGLDKAPPQAADIGAGLQGVRLLAPPAPVIPTNNQTGDAGTEHQLLYSDVPDDSGTQWYALQVTGRSVKLSTASASGAAIQVAFDHPSNWVTLTAGKGRSSPTQFATIYLRRPAALPSNASAYKLMVFQTQGYISDSVGSSYSAPATASGAKATVAGGGHLALSGAPGLQLAFLSLQENNGVGIATLRSGALAAIVNVYAGVDNTGLFICGFNLLPNESARESLPNVDLSAGLYIEVLGTGASVDLGVSTRVQS